MDVRAVRIGSKYGREYEEYLESKLPGIQFLRENKDELMLQWNKLHFFNLDVEGPVCVIDIDIELHGDYCQLFEYPIVRGQFLSMRQWWDPNRKCEINGGFYKFYPADTKYIYDKLMKNPEYWMAYYIKQGIKPGPVNGEENFVDMMVRKKLDLKFVPDEWCCRMSNDIKFITRQNKLSKLPYVYLDRYHPEVKLVHFNA